MVYLGMQTAMTVKAAAVLRSNRLEGLKAQE